MFKASKPLIVLVTTAQRSLADTLATAAIERRLAASAQITAIDSHYRWEGVVRGGEEHELRLFTIEACFDALAALVTDLHDYELPQIVAVPLVKGTPEFLRWLDDCTDSPGPA